MTAGLDLDALLDALAEKVAARLAPQLAGRDGGAATRLLSIQQAARYVGRTRDAINHLIASGRIPTVRADRRVFVDVRDLDAWIQDNKRIGL